MLSILEPIIPHICWELSEELFGLANFGEIKVDSSVFASDEMIYAVTINGKKRAEISVQTSAQKPQIIEQAKQAAQKWLLGTTIKKEVFVPNKLVNFVVV